ncbi:MAG: DUF5684 domain-containing protein [Salibacteraceae bacterium]
MGIETLHDLLKFPIVEIGHILTDHNNQFALILLALLAAFGILGQWVLYYKSNLPGIAAIVPVWNVIVFLKIMGRPAWQAMFIMVPPPVIAYIVYIGDTSMVANVALISMLALFAIFMITLYIELCKCFNKRSLIDYLLVLVFNGFYVMYLGMSANTEYSGPLYGEKAKNS